MPIRAARPHPFVQNESGCRFGQRGPIRSCRTKADADSGSVLRHPFVQNDSECRFGQRAAASVRAERQRMPIRAACCGIRA
jgi:hypothetical protein